MTWIGAIMAARNATGPDLAELAAKLANDPGTPPALVELARSFVSTPLYRADRPRERSTDPETSKTAGARVRGRVRPGGAVHRILRVYAEAIPSYPVMGADPFKAFGPLTSREVEGRTGLRAAHKRTSELLADGLLSVVQVDGEDVVRDGGRVLTITTDGRAELKRLDVEEASR